MSDIATVVSTNDLIGLNESSIRAKRNRNIERSGYGKLDPEGIHFVEFHMVHNDCEIRTMLLCKIVNTMEPVRIFLDMSFEEFNSLAKIGKNEETGEWERV